MLSDGPLDGPSREHCDGFWLLRVRAGLVSPRRPFLGVYLNILGGPGSTRVITCHYRSYGNHLLQRTRCRIRCNEKYICGQGNNRALNYRQHTSNQLNARLRRRRPPSSPQSITSHKLPEILSDKAVFESH